MVIFHSYVSLPEGTWESCFKSHDMIPVAIHLSLDVWSTETSRLTDHTAAMAHLKKPCQQVFHIKQILGKNGTSAFSRNFTRSLYSLLLYNSSPGRSGVPWRWPTGFDLCQKCWIWISIIPAIPMGKTYPSGYLIVNQSNQSMIVNLSFQINGSHSRPSVSNDFNAIQWRTVHFQHSRWHNRGIYSSPPIHYEVLAKMFSLTIDSDIFHNMSAWWHS